MNLSHFHIKNVRSIAEAALSPSPGINFVIGPNGSGKSSLLEAIHILATARSFRTRVSRPVIRRGEASLIVVGSVVSADGSKVRLGVELGAAGMRARIGGRPAANAGELARHFPVMYFGPESLAIIESGPAERRREIDWGVFHVEQNYFAAWRRYTQLLGQRNAALRSPRMRMTVRAWDQELAAAGEIVAAARRVYLDRLIPRVAVVFEVLVGQGTPLLTAGYQQGWPEAKSFADALAGGLERDARDLYTHFGPHRADLVWRVEQLPAREVLSRGQAKLLVLAWKLAAAELVREARGEGCAALLDELAAELDAERRARALSLLHEQQAQIFITGTDAAVVGAAPSARMFHVEQGIVREVV